MPLQLPLPRTLRPSRKATCSASVHGVPFLPSFYVPSLEPLRWWVGVVGVPVGVASPFPRVRTTRPIPGDAAAAAAGGGAPCGCCRVANAPEALAKSLRSFLSTAMASSAFSFSAEIPFVAAGGATAPLLALGENPLILLLSSSSSETVEAEDTGVFGPTSWDVRIEMTVVILSPVSLSLSLSLSTRGVSFVVSLRGERPRRVRRRRPFQFPWSRSRSRCARPKDLPLKSWEIERKREGEGEALRARCAVRSVAKRRRRRSLGRVAMPASGDLDHVSVGVFLWERAGVRH